MTQRSIAQANREAEEREAEEWERQFHIGCQWCGQILRYKSGEPVSKRHTNYRNSGMAFNLFRYCDCPDALAETERRDEELRQAREAEETARVRAREVAAAEQQPARPAQPAKPTPIVDTGWEVIRRQAAKDRKDAELADRERAVKEREIARRERRLDDLDAADATTTPVGATRADFRMEVSLMESAKPPAILTRADGATLLYEGRLNTIYGETAMGKTWVAVETVIPQLRRGGKVVWIDNEDRPKTLAERLQVLRATDLILAHELEFYNADFLESPSAIADALEYLADSPFPGLVILDSAVSLGCPSDGADVGPWLTKCVNPWWEAGHTAILLDHVPKQKKDRPRGGIGSQTKLARVDGAALYVQGQVWNRQQDGFINLYVHKDRQGDLPAQLGECAATIIGVHDGPLLDTTIGLPNAKTEAEDLTEELLDALTAAGQVKGSREMRSLLSGKRGKDVDLARDDLLNAGLIEREKQGQAWVYKVAEN